MVQLKPGRYKAERDNGVFGKYRIIIDFKETEKSYIFKLVELKSVYCPAQIEMFFGKSDKVVIQKNKGGHSMRIWGDDNFTFYPYQAGVPFYFKREE